MAFSQWDISSTLSSPPSLDTLNTIVGTSSLKIRSTIGGTGSASLAMIPKKESLIPHALSKGVLRMLIKPIALGSLTTRGNGIGFACMQSVRDAKSTSCKCYVAFVSADRIAINKLSGGVAQFPSDGLIYTTDYPLIVDTVFSLEFQWNAAMDELGGVDLTVRRGTATNFSDLVDILHVVDSTSPYLWTVGESIVMNITGATQTQEYRVDQTSLYRIL